RGPVLASLATGTCAHGRNTALARARLSRQPRARRVRRISRGEPANKVAQGRQLAEDRDGARRWRMTHQVLGHDPGGIDETNMSMMDRRSFVAGVALGLAAAPITAGAQPRGKVWRVGFLAGGARPPDGLSPLPLRQALQELGYVEPQNVVYLGRWAEAKQDRLPGLAAELVGLKVDVIVTVGGPASAAAKQATSSIPIVLAQVGNADGIGLIESLARPGGNVTGITDVSDELSAKRLEILTEAVPKAARIAVLWNADDRGMTL